MVQLINTMLYDATDYENYVLWYNKLLTPCYMARVIIDTMLYGITDYKHILIYGANDYKHHMLYGTSDLRHHVIWYN